MVAVGFAQKVAFVRCMYVSFVNRHRVVMSGPWGWHVTGRLLLFAGSRSSSATGRRKVQSVLYCYLALCVACQLLASFSRGLLTHPGERKNAHGRSNARRFLLVETTVLTILHWFLFLQTAGVQ